LARSTKRKLTARTADKHVLYQESVQSPESDARFFTRYFKKLSGRSLRILREDFCGTALLCCEFVRLHRENIAIGVDLDAPTLRWAHVHNLSRLPPEMRERVHLAPANVLELRRPKVDAIAALNFSYSVFKTRRELLAYVKTAYAALKHRGVLFLDAWGGGETQFLLKERRRLHGFTYVWDQAEFDPITHEILCKIHYEFRDGTRMRNAFVYDWRLWTLPELRELLFEAGFADVHVLWEGTDRKTGKGNGIFRRVARGGQEKAWVAYVVGRKP
jgi:SAM-dependent methyltransferase